jgi:hypothetical protein
MERARWNPLKNEWLRITRGVSFKKLIDHGKLLSTRRHPKRANQRMMLFEYQGYVWVVPYVRDRRGKFLKTLYQSRRYTKLYRRGIMP